MQFMDAETSRSAVFEKQRMLIFNNNVIFCAPKTGCSSLTAIAEIHGIHHQGIPKQSYWHEIDAGACHGRNIFLTVREPSDRLASMACHFVKETGGTLEEFIDDFESHDQFFNWNQAMWYRPILHLDWTLLRLEERKFALSNYFGWRDDILPVNKSDEGMKQRAVELLSGKFQDWIEEDRQEFGY